MLVHIVQTTNGAPSGKLAETELHFDEGLLSGLRLVGFAIWEGRNGHGRNVTFPARQYSVHGKRRHTTRCFVRSTTRPPQSRCATGFSGRFPTTRTVRPLVVPCSLNRPPAPQIYFLGRRKNAGVSSEVSSSSRSPSSDARGAGESAGSPTTGRRVIGTWPPTAWDIGSSDCHSV